MERGYPVAEVSQRLRVSVYSLYEWKKEFETSNVNASDETEEIRRLKKNLARVTEERDIVKKRPRIWPEMQSEGFAYLAVVTDIYPRRVIGWEMQSH